MRNDGQKPGGGNGGGGGSSGGGFIPTSFKALSSYLRIVSSGASTVASTVRSAASAASAIVERDSDSFHDQVHWAAFDNLQCDGHITRQVLLLGFRNGFQVWDVEDVSNVHNLVSRQDGPVSFMQILPKLLASKQDRDKFANSRPLLLICADGCFPGGSDFQECSSRSGTIHYGHELPNCSGVPTVVCFYSLRSHSYVHQLKFRSVVHLVRCSSRIIAVLQASQIHCFDAATLETDYNILTNPIPLGCGSGCIGFGPLALGPRWMAYSGSPVGNSNSGHVSPQQLTPPRFPSPASNGSLVAHYAKESSKQLAAGLMTLGDMGYKKLSRYYSELLPDGNNSQSGSPRLSGHGVANSQLHDVENDGMVVVRDIVEKTLITQFRAHKSPISSLCFDPTGTLLVTASVHGHNINVFRIIPRDTSGAGFGASYVHLYRLQRGFTNAVIQDICFSRDSEWILISSSRGTSHLFAISPFLGSSGIQSADVCLSSKGSGLGIMMRSPACSTPHSGAQVYDQQCFRTSDPPVTLSVVSRIRSGNNGWRNTVTGAAAAASGRMNSPAGAIAAAFHYYKGSDSYLDTSFLKTNCHLLVFSSPGCLIQYAMRVSSGLDSLTTMHELGMGRDPCLENDAKLVVEAMRKWNICHKQNCKERDENVDIYGENGHYDSSKVFPEGIRKKGVYSEARNTVSKDKMASEEKYHLYISEAELQMHQHRVPLWMKAEIYFQTMATDGINTSEESAFEGEIEIERIPTRMIEVSSKELVPVFEYLQAPKLQPGRQVLNHSKDRQLLYQRSGMSENRKLAYMGSSGSLDSMSGGLAVTELHNGAEETGWVGLQVPTNTTKGFVNTADYSKANGRLEIVNNRESSVTETQFSFVNNSIGVLTSENQFEGSGDEVL
ncbi:autophagy-related protein 18f [Coffea eugenioides]|uniref:autophagy-related protein 18f n=1 Tax=Coffea eugenioides TaxID=49369 RepID=UPI000F60D313|nr:autophagy-related protein 18f [Coffea eugenioides]